MKKIKFFVWIFLLWLLGTVFGEFVRIGGIIPELLYVFTLCIAMHEKRFSHYIFVAIICGAIMDSTLTNPGFYIVFYTITTLIIVGMGELIYRDKIFMIIPITFVFSFAQSSIYFLISRNLFQDMEYIKALKSIIIPTAIYNSAVAILINPLVKKILYPKRKIIRR